MRDGSNPQAPIRGSHPRSCRTLLVAPREAGGMARPSQAEKMAPRCAAMREVLHRWTNAEEILPIWDQLTAQVSDERDKASRARTAGDWRRAEAVALAGIST